MRLVLLIFLAKKRYTTANTAGPRRLSKIRTEVKEAAVKKRNFDKNHNNNFNEINSGIVIIIIIIIIIIITIIIIFYYLYNKFIHRLFTDLKI